MDKIKKGDTVMFRCCSKPNLWKAQVLRAHRDGSVTVACPSDHPYACDGPRLQLGQSELVPDRVRIEVIIDWGNEWTGSYYKKTPGVGCYVQVMEYDVSRYDRGPGFRGCPLGSGSTVEAAIGDFVSRGRYEYQGVRLLARYMVDVARTTDRRKTEDER